MQRIVKFPYKQVRDISMKAIQRNAYFSHQEAVILEILAHENDVLRKIAVNKYKHFIAHVQGYKLKIIMVLKDIFRTVILLTMTQMAM